MCIRDRTEGTIRSETYNKVIHSFKEDAVVIGQPCPLFVPLVEEGFAKHHITKEVIDIYLSNMRNTDIDTMILGCTHYPLLRSSIIEYFLSLIHILFFMKRRSAGRNLMRVRYGNTWTKLKKAGAYLTIMVLLPYIITVFIHGPGLVSTSNVDQTYIKVKTENGSLEMPIEEYCVGILAKEIPANYEEEVLKAQAVLVRTNVYRLSLIHI